MVGRVYERSFVYMDLVMDGCLCLRTIVRKHRTEWVVGRVYERSFVNIELTMGGWSCLRTIVRKHRTDNGWLFVFTNDRS